MYGAGRVRRRAFQGYSGGTFPAHGAAPLTDPTPPGDPAGHASPPDASGPGGVDDLADAVSRHALEVDAAAIPRLHAYHASLCAWNERLNLTRHLTVEKFVLRDLWDTLRLAELLSDGERVLDVGSGGGVPGVPLAILRPGIDVSLCESVGKKARALEAIVGELGLATPVHATRVERLLDPADGAQRYDTLVARAVAPLWKFMRWLRPTPQAWERLLLIKGPSWVEERGEARHRGLMHGYQLRRVAEYRAPEMDSPSTVLEVRKGTGATERRRPKRGG